LKREKFSKNLPENLIAITGTIASGKSAVLKIAHDSGYPVISADNLSKKVMVKGNACFDALKSEFGNIILDEKGDIDRKKLLSIVVVDLNLKKKLEDIVHPAIFELLEAELEELKSRGFKWVFVEVPLLFEGDWQDFFDYAICVTSPEKFIMERMLLRHQDNPEVLEMALKLKESHFSQEKKALLSDFVIENSGDLHELEEKFKKIISEIIHKH